MKFLSSVASDVLKRLGDTSEKIWSTTEVRNYLQEGYDQLAMQSLCFWSQAYLDDKLTTGNFTSDFESDWFDGGDVRYRRFAYTCLLDADWVAEGDLDYGPTNHTAGWEGLTYITEAYYVALEDLPDDLYEIERSTWNYARIEPLRSVELELNDSRYQLNNGEVLGYAQDKDGLGKFRKWRIPSAAADTYMITDPCRGILRNPSDISTETVHGSWGIPRRIPTQPAVAETWWGLPRRPFKDGHNTKVEYFSRGKTLNTDQPFDLPDRYVKYVRHYALWKALERNGPGQDIKLGQHWKGRFDDGVARMIRRRQSLTSNRQRVLGDTLLPFGPPPRPKYPWNYGQVVR